MQSSSINVHQQKKQTITSAVQAIALLESEGHTDAYAQSLIKKSIRGKKQLGVLVDVIHARPSDVTINDWVTKSSVQTIASASKQDIKAGFSTIIAKFTSSMSIDVLHMDLERQIAPCFPKGSVKSVLKNTKPVIKHHDNSTITHNVEKFTSLVSEYVLEGKGERLHALIENTSINMGKYFESDWKELSEAKKADYEVTIRYVVEEAAFKITKPKHSLSPKSFSKEVVLNEEIESLEALANTYASHILRELMRLIQAEVENYVIPKLRQALLSSIIKTKAKFETYKDLFPKARSRKRKFIYLQGETNSGKTYEALRELSGASTGVYLSPLRLLAAEVSDQLNDSGIPCNLITGEERELVEGANHVSCTIEILDHDLRYDVAVIDEIQMLADEDRSGAWINAVIGVNADIVYLCGSGEIEDELVDLIDYLGEPLEIKRFSRKTELVVHDKRVSLSYIPANTGLITFSGSQVERLQQSLEQRGIQASKLYGAMPAEVRRSEAAKFRSGETQVIISTDVISMGMNLPIENVVFTETKKFNGRTKIPVPTTLSKQIAGRAGRYGMYEKGNVYALNTIGEDDANSLLESIRSPMTQLKIKRQVQFNRTTLKAISEVTNEHRMSELLSIYENNVEFDFGIENNISEFHYSMAKLVDREGGSLSFKEKCALIKIPANSTELHLLKRLIVTIDCMRNRHGAGLHVSVEQGHTYFHQNASKAEQRRSIDVLNWFAINFNEFSQLTGLINEKKQSLIKEWG